MFGSRGENKKKESFQLELGSPLGNLDVHFFCPSPPFCWIPAGCWAESGQGSGGCDGFCGQGG